MSPSFTKAVLQDNREVGMVNNSPEVPVRHREVFRSLAWRPLGNAESPVGSWVFIFPHFSLQL